MCYENREPVLILNLLKSVLYWHLDNIAVLSVSTSLLLLDYPECFASEMF